MSKRFTDTEKWKKAWFRKLKPAHKCLWYFLLDNCDAAGVIDLDFDLASFQIGEDIVEADLDIFEDRVEKISEDKFVLVDFISYQYGELKENYNPHKAALAALAKQNLQVIDGKSKLAASLRQPCGKLLDKDQDKDQDKDKDKNQDKNQEGSKKAKLNLVGPIEEFAGDPTTEVMLEKVSHAVQREWLKIYPDASWIKTEIIKAHTWELSNPARGKKNKAAFIGKWLSNGKKYGAPPGSKFDRVVATNQQAMNDLFSGKWDLGEGAA